jgi:hypothetical protein
MAGASANAGVASDRRTETMQTDLTNANFMFLTIDDRDAVHIHIAPATQTWTNGL